MPDRQPVEIHTCGHRTVMAIAPVPADMIGSGTACVVNEGSYWLTQDVIHRQAYVGMPVARRDREGERGH